LAQFPCFEPRRINHLVVAAITELVVHMPHALPLMSGFERGLSFGGTEGSNPSPSSGESRANLTSAATTAYAVVKRKISASGAIEGWWSERGFAGKTEVEERCVAFRRRCRCAAVVFLPMPGVSWEIDCPFAANGGGGERRTAAPAGMLRRKFGLGSEVFAANGSLAFI